MGTKEKVFLIMVERKDISSENASGFERRRVHGRQRLAEGNRSGHETVDES
jgi:hypothetical protein